MTTSVSELMIEAGQKARAASRRMAAASTADKNKALLRLAELLETERIVRGSPARHGKSAEADG